MSKTISQRAALKAAKAYADAEMALQKVELQANQEKAEVDQNHAEAIKDFTLLRDNAAALLGKYFEDHRSELLTGSAKSTSFGGLTLGAKKSPAKLTLVKGMSWDDVKAKLKELGASGKKFLKRKEEVDKTNLKNKGDEELLTSLGVTVEQTENFYIKL